MLYWAICPECLTYIWVEESSIADEDTANCPYCDIPISLIGGEELVGKCRELQVLIEEIEHLVSVMPAAIDVHRFLFEQVEYIAGAFNDRLDQIQADKDVVEIDSDIEAQRAS